jgi:hypothetical protein
MIYLMSALDIIYLILALNPFLQKLSLSEVIYSKFYLQELIFKIVFIKFYHYFLHLVYNWRFRKISQEYCHNMLIV